jgi:hypothetical protein
MSAINKKTTLAGRSLKQGIEATFKDTEISGLSSLSYFSCGCVQAKDLISIKTHEASRLSSWPGWKQTVAGLVAEKPVMKVNTSCGPARQISIY